MGGMTSGGEDRRIGNTDSEGLAPVIPLFGGADPRESGATSAEPMWRSTWDDDVADARAPRTRSDDRSSGSDLDDDGPGPARDERAAFDRVLKKLRTRGLSVAEATSSLLSDGVDRAAAAAFIADLERKRWLSDADLAEQLIHSAVTRKGEGRRAIAQTLAKRGIPRDVADAALSSLPDDDADRALEFARTKARGMAALDRDTAVRRLVGQLARRGYPGSVAMTAARAALDELGSGASGVRFR